MTVLNRLLCEIKDGAEEVHLRRCDVRTIAEHARLTQFYRLSIDDIEARICRGEMKILGCRVIVGIKKAGPVIEGRPE